MSDKARQKPWDDPAEIGVDNEPTLQNSLNEDADTMHGKEKEQNEVVPSSRIAEEHTRKEEQITTRPTLRASVSSFAAPTRASEAKKNEKIELAQFIKKGSLGKELPGWTSSAIPLQPASVPVGRHPSLKRHSIPRPNLAKDHAGTAEFSSRIEKRRETRSQSLVSAVSDGSAEEEEIGERLEEPRVIENEALEKQLPEQQTQVEEEVQKEEEPLVHDEKELGEMEASPKKEPPEYHIEESEVELEVSQEPSSTLIGDSTALALEEVHVKIPESQIETPQDQVESMSQSITKEDGTGTAVISADNNDTALDEIAAEKEELRHELAQAEAQRDEAMRQCETVQQDLETVKDDTKKLKEENNKLITQLRESQNLIAARNAREPNLPALEAIEAENRRLRMAVDKKEKERSDANACCRNLDDQLRDAQEKLSHQVTSIKQLCHIFDAMSRTVSRGEDIPLPHTQALNEGLAQASEIETLKIKITLLVKTFGEDLKKEQNKNRELERQVADLKYEITQLDKSLVAQKRELLIPSLQSPLLSPEMTLDRNEFKDYYQQERQKRKEVELELSKAEKLLSHLHPKNEKLQSDLAKAQEELANLRPKADRLEKVAEGWKEDSEEKKSQLEKRTDAFETSSNQQRQETLKYIRDYYRKIKDEAYWEVEGLHKKLATEEESRRAIERDFAQAKVENARLADGVTRLRKMNKKRNADIGKIQESIVYGEGFPDLSDEDYSSSSASTSTSSSPTNPLDRVRRRVPIPRCHLPTAINARNAKIAAYMQELQNVREQELFNVSAKPSTFFNHRIDMGRKDIMEKVREWKMGDSYPPKKPEWGEVRRKSAWERWDGETWAKECAQGNDIEMLKKCGLWNEAWD
ncbi:hypothetical protein ACET3X_009646 [Alternaria dauci]|uniref:Spindle pole body-associated protein cut12 domain-containing protein n=1 Tax=Alternaria dauci TaxID=48095 RepID=A0ABR3U627_9PLEO